MRFVVLLLLLSSIISCSKDSFKRDCVDVFLHRYDMELYKGGDIECGRSYIVMYAFEDSYFPYLQNDCADLNAQEVVLCDGTKLCYENEPEGCYFIFQNAEYLGIIGVTP